MEKRVAWEEGMPVLYPWWMVLAGIVWTLSVPRERMGRLRSHGKLWDEHHNEDRQEPPEWVVQESFLMGTIWGCQRMAVGLGDERGLWSDDARWCEDGRGGDSWAG